MTAGTPISGVDVNEPSPALPKRWVKTCAVKRQALNQLCGTFKADLRDCNICRSAFDVLAVRDTADFRIVFRATIGAIHVNGNPRRLAELFKQSNQCGVNFICTFATAMAREFAGGKVFAQSVGRLLYDVYRVLQRLCT